VAKRNALSNELIVASACRDAALDPDVHRLVISGGDTFFFGRSRYLGNAETRLRNDRQYRSSIVLERHL